MKATLRRDILPALGGERIDRLTARRIAQVVADWERAGKGVRTITLAHAILYRCLDQAVRWHWLARNPAAGVDLPRYTPAPHAVWTAAQARTFLAATAAADPWGPFYRLALLAELRESELIGLRWADVDWAHRLLRCSGQYTVAHEYHAPKTSRGERWVPLDTETLAALRRRAAAQRQQAARLGTDWPESDWVFTTRAGTPLMHRNVRRRFAEDTDRAGLPRIRFHDLRGTRATLLAEQGVSERIVADRVGHATTRVTREHYLRLGAERQRGPVDAVAATLAVPALSGRRFHVRRHVGDTPGIQSPDPRDTAAD